MPADVSARWGSDDHVRQDSGESVLGMDKEKGKYVVDAHDILEQVQTLARGFASKKPLHLKFAHAMTLGERVAEACRRRFPGVDPHIFDVWRIKGENGHYAVCCFVCNDVCSGIDTDTSWRAGHPTTEKHLKKLAELLNVTYQCLCSVDENDVKHSEDDEDTDDEVDQLAGDSDTEDGVEDLDVPAIATLPDPYIHSYSGEGADVEDASLQGWSDTSTDERESCSSSLSPPPPSPFTEDDLALDGDAPVDTHNSSSCSSDSSEEVPLATRMQTRKQLSPHPPSLVTKKSASPDGSESSDTNGFSGHNSDSSKEVPITTQGLACKRVRMPSDRSVTDGRNDQHKQKRIRSLDQGCLPTEAPIQARSADQGLIIHAPQPTPAIIRRTLQSLANSRNQEEQRAHPTVPNVPSPSITPNTPSTQAGSLQDFIRYVEELDEELRSMLGLSYSLFFPPEPEDNSHQHTQDLHDDHDAHPDTLHVPNEQGQTHTSIQADPSIAPPPSRLFTRPVPVIHTSSVSSMSQTMFSQSLSRTDSMMSVESSSPLVPEIEITRGVLLNPSPPASLIPHLTQAYIQAEMESYEYYPETQF